MCRRAAACGAALLLAMTVAVAAPAVADHTDPREPLAPIDGVVVSGQTRGDGVWRHLANFPGLANPALTGGGTDLEFFRTGRSERLFGSFGTLGQDGAGSVGQRIIRLVTARGRVKPKWVADHGSGHCAPASTVRDRSAARRRRSAGTAGSRCSPTPPTRPGAATTRPAAASRSSTPPTCSGRSSSRARCTWSASRASRTPTPSTSVGRGSSTAAPRTSTDGRGSTSSTCVPATARRPSTSRKRRGEVRPQGLPDQPSAGVDPAARPDHRARSSPARRPATTSPTAASRLYCAAINSTVILDVRRLVEQEGPRQGQASPVPGRRRDRHQRQGHRLQRDGRGPAGEGVRLEARRPSTHPGRDCGSPGTDNRTCNSNNLVRSDEGVAVSHEADPSPDRRFMFVTDERGGGIVPPGSSCAPGIENPFGNGGAHAFDISDPANIKLRHHADGREGGLHQRRRRSGGDLLRHPRHRARPRRAASHRGLLQPGPQDRRLLRRRRRGTSSSRSVVVHSAQHQHLGGRDFKIREQRRRHPDVLHRHQRHPPGHRHGELDRAAQPGRRRRPRPPRRR